MTIALPLPPPCSSLSCDMTASVCDICDLPVRNSPNTFFEAGSVRQVQEEQKPTLFLNYM